MIINKYNYPNLERVEIEGKRFYRDSNQNPVPSVTTVLSETSKSKGDIENWKRRVGHAEAERITKQSTEIGTQVHEAIEQYFYKKEWNNFNDDMNGSIAKRISEKFVNDCLNNINEIWGVEVGLVLDNLYAGTADCIGLYNNNPSIIDFKTAKKIKKKEWIEDYFLQGCAYANAHNVMFNTDVEQIVILMVDRDLVFKEFIIKSNEFPYYTKIWKKRLIEFSRVKKI